MTLREKLAIEHPECIDEKWHGGCKDCPHQYGYKEMKDCECDSKTVNDEICRKCWDQKYEGELTPQEKKIEELERKLFHMHITHEMEIKDRKMYRDALHSLIDHIESKTGIWIPYHGSHKAKDVFDMVLSQRNKWSLATFILAGVIIGNIIATFLI